MPTINVPDRLGVMDLYAVLDPVQTAEIIQRATVYRAACGRRRAYKTEAEALAYDRGFNAFPAPFDGEMNTPESDGWFDAETQFQEQFDACRDDCRERQECDA